MVCLQDLEKANSFIQKVKMVEPDGAGPVTRAVIMQSIGGDVQD